MTALASETEAVVEILTNGRDNLAFHVGEYLGNANNYEQAVTSTEHDREFIQALTQAIDILTPAPKDAK